MPNPGDCKHTGKCKIMKCRKKYSPFCDGDGIVEQQDCSYYGWPALPPEYIRWSCNEFEKDK